MILKTSRLAGLAALIALSLPLAAAAQEVKIAFVDREKALFSTEQGKKARAELQSKVTAAKSQLQPMADEIQKLQSELEAKKFVLAQEALRDMQAKMLELQNRYESKGKELENQLKIDQARLVAPLEDRLKATIEAVGKEQGYSLILERQVPGLIYYAREAHDITDAVVTRFNSGK
jgi:outer membrane protein